MNKQSHKTPMKERDPGVRSKDFSEVALGYTEKDAQNEAERCLGCKNRPCVAGCPVSVPIPEFIAKVGEGDFSSAYDVIYSQNSLPAVCGRVCPQERQCEALCVRGRNGDPVGIGRLERFCADFRAQSKTLAPPKPDSNGKRIAVIGSGPASLTCASELAKLGFEVTVFEAFHAAGGVLVYGIPEFRLPKEIVKCEIEALGSLGVKIELNMVIGQILTIDEMFSEGFEAVFIGAGAGLPGFLGVSGEGLIGVYSANEFLTRVNLMRAYDPNSDTPLLPSKRTVVVGGGNVAMDAARCARRLGAEVTILYRRGYDELPARREEVEHAKEEGITFKLFAAPAEIIGGEDGRVRSVTCQLMELGEPDESGRRKPVPIEGSLEVIECDTVISAVGTSPNPLLARSAEGLELTPRGCIAANPETGETSRKGVFAGGDITTGAATVILAMGAGKKAAAGIVAYLGIDRTIGKA